MQNFLAFLVLLNLASQAVCANEKEIQVTKRFRLSLNLVGLIDGPRHDVEQAMRDAGFDYFDPTNNFFLSSYPTTKSSRSMRLTFNAHYLWKQPLGIGISWYKLDFGETQGRTANTGIPLTIDYSMTSIVSLAYFRYEILEFGLGISRNILRANEYESESAAKVKYGLVFDASLTIPRDRMFFFELKWHYNKIGNSTIGPFDRFAGLEKIVFPESTVNYSHAAMGLGFGIRF